MLNISSPNKFGCKTIGTGEVVLYVDQSSGDDNNTGITTDSTLLTLPKAFSLVKYFNKATITLLAKYENTEIISLDGLSNELTLDLNGHTLWLDPAIISDNPTIADILVDTPDSDYDAMFGFIDVHNLIVNLNHGHVIYPASNIRSGNSEKHSGRLYSSCFRLADKKSEHNGIYFTDGAIQCLDLSTLAVIDNKDSYVVAAPNGRNTTGFLDYNKHYNAYSDSCVFKHDNRSRTSLYKGETNNNDVLTRSYSVGLSETLSLLENIEVHS